jgi:hypothetical protein
MVIDHHANSFQLKLLGNQTKPFSSSFQALMMLHAHTTGVAAHVQHSLLTTSIAKRVSTFAF